MSGIRPLSFLSYLSRGKVSQLYDQLFTSTISETVSKRTVSGRAEAEGSADALFSLFKAGLKMHGGGEFVREEKSAISYVQKLQYLINYIDENESVLDLNKLCIERRGRKLDAFIYSYAGEFRGDSEIYQTRVKGPEAFQAAAVNDNAFPEVGPNKGKLVSGVGLIRSNCGGYEIILSCSHKYFSDMGGSWNDKSGEWSVSPHSGNYHFFNGEAPAWLSGLIFINAVKENVIYGTPLFMTMGLQPDARI